MLVFEDMDCKHLVKQARIDLKSFNVEAPAMSAMLALIKNMKRPSCEPSMKLSLHCALKWDDTIVINSTISLVCSEPRPLTRHNQESTQKSPDPFPHERVGSGRKLQCFVSR